MIVQNLPKAHCSQLISFLAEKLESAPEVEFLLCWLRPLLIFHSDALTSKDLETVSNLKNALKSLKRRVNRIAEM